MRTNCALIWVSLQTLQFDRATVCKWHSYPRVAQLLTSAATATIAKKPFTTNSSARGLDGRLGHAALPVLASMIEVANPD